MTEISCSNGDLSSTPSNVSEYYSVTSSLNIMNSTEEVYHSVDEEIECQNNANFSSKYYQKRFQHHKIVKQNHLDIEHDQENGFILTTSVETIPELGTYRNNVECEFWDKCLHPLQMKKSHESLNTFEEECNNSSIFSDIHGKDSSIIDDYNDKTLSDNEESFSVSINNTTQLNTSQIEGELSDINDIVYESSTSPINAANPIISAEENSSQFDMENDINDQVSFSANPDIIINDNLISSYEIESKLKEIDINKAEHLPIYEMVKELESRQLEEDLKSIKDQIIIQENILERMESIHGNSIINQNCSETLPQIRRLSFNIESKKIPIEIVEESPIKRSFLCCSIKRKAKKIESPKTNSISKFKAKKLFSFLKKSKKDKKINQEIIIIEPTNNCQNYNTNVVKSFDIDYDSIPYIDADVAIDTEEYISLAKQEYFSD